MSEDDELRMREILRAAVPTPDIDPDPYARLVARIRRRNRRRAAAASGLAVAGVAVAIILPTKLVGPASGGKTAPPLGTAAVSPAKPTTRTPASGQAPTPSAATPSTATPSVTAPVIDQTGAVLAFMQSDHAFARSAFGGTNIGAGYRPYCGVRVLGQSSDGRSLYAYFICMQFSNDAGTLRDGAGIAAPVLLHVAGRGPQTNVLSWQLPEDGSLYGPSIRTMFPAQIADEMLRTPAGLPSANDLRARAAADLAAGRL